MHMETQQLIDPKTGIKVFFLKAESVMTPYFSLFSTLIGDQNVLTCPWMFQLGGANYPT